MRRFRCFWFVKALFLGACGILATSWPAQAEPPQAAELRQQYLQQATALGRSEFGRPLLLESSQTSHRAEGQVGAVLDLPLSQVLALASAPRWCEVLMLHQTTRRCQVLAQGREIELEMSSTSQGLGPAFTIRLKFTMEHSDPGYLAVRLNAEQGPMGSHNYDLRLQAIALPLGGSFLRFAYRYDVGWMARWAIQAYLSTRGSQKVGFSRVQAPGQPAELVRGMRGLIERNTMRYFLALESVLLTLNVPPERMEQRLLAWYDATERYPRQLHEMSRQEYLSLKRQSFGLEP